MKTTRTVAWALTIVLVCVLASAVLVAVFSTSSPHASMIQWDRMEQQKAAKAEQRLLQPLSKPDQLAQLWAEPRVLGAPGLQPSQRDEWARLGFRDLTQGLVLAAGGPVLTGQARQLARELRRAGCRLPIQLWYRRGELDSLTIQTLEAESQVLCACLEVEAPRWPCTVRFAIKILALYLCPFDTALYLDADMHVCADPTPLLAWGAEHGAVFWPDLHPLQTDAPCYQQFTPAQKAQLPPWQQNSAQLLLRLDSLNRTRLWTIYRLLEHQLSTLFPAPFNYGDKDMFCATWVAQARSTGEWLWVTGRVQEVLNATGDVVVALAHADPLDPSRVLFVQDLQPPPLTAADYATLRHPDTLALTPLSGAFLPFLNL